MNNVSNMGDLINEEVSRKVLEFRATPVEQLEREERQREEQRKYEALHTRFETEQDRMNRYLFWSEEHGEVEISAECEQDAWDKFYEEYSGNGDYEVTLEQITEEANDD
jgi:hypothetical protein